MSKRRACEASLEPLSPTSKKPRLADSADNLASDASLRAHRPNPRKRSLLEDADDARDPAASNLISKKARIDNSPTDSHPHSRSPSPWPIIEDHVPQEDPAEEIRQEWQRQIHEAMDRSEAAFRQARQEYAKFRKNRLPSPAPSDEGSRVIDSEEDEFGYVPANFNLENDDPEVEQVFGAAYAHRIAQRAGRWAPAAPIRPQKVSSPPPSISTNHPTESREHPETTDSPSEQHVTVETHEAVSAVTETEAMQLPRGRRQNSTRLSRARTDRGKRRLAKKNKNRIRLSASPLSPTSGTLAGTMLDKDDLQPPLARRLTRRSRQQEFYELDWHGTPRLVRKG